MQIKTKILYPEEISVSLEVTMTLRNWKKLLSRLEKTEYTTDTEEFLDAIRELVSRVETVNLLNLGKEKENDE